MAQVTKTRSYLTGNTLSASNYNDDRDEVINGVNSINNSQIASDAAIAATKLALDTSNVVKVTNLDVTGLSAGQVLKVNSGGTAVEGGGAGRAFTWGILGTLSTGNEQGMKYIVPQGMTVNKLWAKTESGTCTIRIQEDTGDIGTLAVTTSVGSTTSFSDSTLTAGTVMTLDLTVASGTAVFVTLECTQQ